MKISIHGGMAVGKTSLIKKIEKKYPCFGYSYENLSEVIKIMKSLNLNKEDYDDYLINQGLFVDHEIKRYNALDHDLIIMDYSAEEVAFQTWSYQKVFHPEWSIEEIGCLINKLEPYYVDHILYLYADNDVLTRRKENDLSRQRKSFDKYLYIHDYKKEWFKQLDSVTILDTTNMSEDEVLIEASKWLEEIVY